MTEPREDAPITQEHRTFAATAKIFWCGIEPLAQMIANRDRERERAVRLTEQQIRDALTSWHIDCGNWQLVGITKMLNADLSTSAQPAAGQETEET